MNYINKLFIVFLLVGLGFSCSLDEEPYGFLSSENFYETENDAESAVAHMYDILGDVEYYSRYMFYIAEAPTEECFFKDDVSVDEKDLGELKTTSTNTILTWMFKAAYIGINRCNVVLENVPNIKMNERYKNQILGEAYFLRALHNFNLVRTFGEVPLRGSSIISAEQIDEPIAGLETVYEAIEYDLLEAEKMMDTVPRHGRANVVATWALLSKVYLTMASSSASGVPKYEFIGNPDDYYVSSATYAKKVLDQPEYEFWDEELSALWDIDSESGNEFIFSVAFAADGEDEGDYSKLSMLLVPYVDGAAIFLEPEYETVIPDGWGHLKTDINFYNSFDSTDKRKTELIISSVKDAVGKEKRFDNGTLEYPFSRKHIDKNQKSDATGKDYPVIRYSDILLGYAEAVGPTTEGYEAINRIRNRAGLPDLASGLSLSDFREKVFEERTFELAFEGHRLFELRRTHKMVEVLEGQYNKTISENPYFYSLPQSETDNNGAINN